MLTRKLVAEFIGTALLLTAIVGSGIMAERLAGDSAVALLCNSLATGAALVVLITILGPISGAHLNPAVTLSFRLRNLVTTSMALAYMGSQLVGALTGTLIAHLMFSEPVLELGTQAREGPNLWLAEAVATFGLVLAIFGALRWKPDAVPSVVGLYILSAYWFTASTSFANPAVTIARSFTDTFSGIEPAGVGPFVFAQLIGGLAATILSGWLFAETPPNDHR